MCGISHPTAHLWRHKIFATVDGYQDHLILSDRIWIDETYLNDTRIMHEFGKKRKRGLSKDQICIVVAIDVHKNMIAIQCGNGNPTGNRIEGALLNHIKPGSVIVHDGNAAHNQLIAKAGCTSEVYKADTDDPKYIEQMQLINNMCGWLQRFLYKVMGMRMENLQSYLNSESRASNQASSTDRCSICQKILISYTHFRLLPDKFLNFTLDGHLHNRNLFLSILVADAV